MYFPTGHVSAASVANVLSGSKRDQGGLTIHRPLLVLAVESAHEAQISHLRKKEKSGMSCGRPIVASLGGIRKILGLPSHRVERDHH